VSRGVITNIDDAENNNYIVNVPDIGETSAQCVTKDEILLGTEVRIADIDNEPPVVNKGHGNLRFLPNTHTGQEEENIPVYTYSTNSVWKKPKELWETNNKHQLVKGYILSSERNRRWQKEYPLYKKGKVASITDAEYMEVEIYGDSTRSCKAQYMQCDTAAFEADDIVVVFYEYGSYERPVVVGFWDEPVDCLYWATYIQLYMYYLIPGQPTVICCPIRDGASFYINNIEFNTDSGWVSRFTPDYWNDGGSFYAKWETSNQRYLTYPTFGNYCNQNWTGESVIEHTQWLNENRPSQLRINWTNNYNCPEKLGMIFSVYSFTSEYVYDTFYDFDDYTYSGSCDNGYTSNTILNLDWAGIPNFNNAAIDWGEPWET